MPSSIQSHLPTGTTGGACSGRISPWRRAVHAAQVMTLAVLAACGGPSGQDPQPPQAESNLYMTIGDDPMALYAVNMTTGKASKVGSGLADGADRRAMGLAPSSLEGQLYAADRFDLLRVGVDGQRTFHVGSGPFTEGLAYDPQNDVLYASSNGFLHVRSPITGTTIETWVYPPNAQDVEGLAFDPESRTLYGLIRGATEQPQFNDIWFALYAMTVDEGPREWRTVGSTERLWSNAGLAFDLDAGVLYAIGALEDPDALFQIDPATGATTRVGSTGLQLDGGGLAWMKE